MNQHATALQWKNTGMIFIGPSGCGKSSLALDLIAQGAILIADDQIILSQENDHWIATCPETIRNKIHLRDIGILHLQAQPETNINLVFYSDRPVTKLSTIPELGVPAFKLNFMSDKAINFIFNTLTSFDSDHTLA